HTITVAGNSGFNPVVDVRSGTCNGISIGCADATGNSAVETVTVSGLTIGSTYYIRVYSYGASASNSGTFTISVVHEVPPANDECTNAITLISSTGISGVLGTTLGASQSLEAITCNALTGTADDDVWYKFVAVSNKHNIAVIGGPEVDVVVDIRSGACNGTTIACSDATKEAGKEELTLSNLIIGNTYYIRVYSFGNARANRGQFGILINHEECPATANITQPITSGTVTMKAIQITATNQVSEAKVTYRGADSVTLQPGFKATVNTSNVFQAIIAGCP
ncbi:3-coathanger stack domain-containing protein, partial [Emticicia agri]